MDPLDKLKLEQGRVLRQAREAAGFKSISMAVRASPKYEKWKTSTVSAHERGFRQIGQDDAERYARFYRDRGARITGKEILYADSESSSSQSIVEAKLEALAVQVKKLAEGAREQRLARPPAGGRHRSIPKVPPRGSKS
jgi:hypothetical protein